MKEAEKNIFICAALTIICGAGLIAMDKTTIGALTLVLGAVFIIAGITMIIKRKNEDKSK